MYSVRLGSLFLPWRGFRGDEPRPAADVRASRPSAPTVADSSVGSACASCCAGVKFSSTGASAADWAKFSGASAAAAWAASVVVASSLANLRWKEAIDHCCCFRRNAEGAMLLMHRDCPRYALEGEALMARTAVRRRRNLSGGISICVCVYICTSWSSQQHRGLHDGSVSWSLKMSKGGGLSKKLKFWLWLSSKDASVYCTDVNYSQMFIHSCLRPWPSSTS